ncbi:hypothetical protein ADL28_40000 [Streptomyces violaceusniger]|uniref:Uncharacterized protein n=1 Tax=Streptomyces violaceusniger TaxID=68280 RepID=A0A0X3VJX7_STRVO|nr:hypothetical protein ADL28_40000 [Streptomyces violaceusniger]
MVTSGNGFTETSASWKKQPTEFSSSWNRFEKLVLKTTLGFPESAATATENMVDSMEDTLDPDFLSVFRRARRSREDRRDDRW